MRSQEEVEKRLAEIEERLRKDDPVWHWSGHSDGEIIALKWVLEKR